MMIGKNEEIKLGSEYVRNIENQKRPKQLFTNRIGLWLSAGEGSINPTILTIFQSLQNSI